MIRQLLPYMLMIMPLCFGVALVPQLGRRLPLLSAAAWSRGEGNQWAATLGLQQYEFIESQGYLAALYS